MSKVPVGDVKVGDVIADAVYDDDGKRFLPKGIKLNSALITRLRDRGIVEVIVESADSTDEYIASGPQMIDVWKKDEKGQR